MVLSVAMSEPERRNLRRGLSLLYAERGGPRVPNQKKTVKQRGVGVFVGVGGVVRVRD